MEYYSLTEETCQAIASKFKTDKSVKICIDAFLDGDFVTHSFIDGEILKWELQNKKFNKAYTYYIENHELYGRAWSRQNSQVFLLRNIVIDIDAIDHHGSSDLTSHKKKLAELMLKKLKYKPSMLVCTGRGVQVWYNIEETSRLLEWLYMEVVHALFDDARAVLANSELSTVFEIDKRTEQFSKNFRLPGSFHSGVQEYTYIYYDSETEYSLNDLPRKLEQKEIIYKPTKPKKKAKKVKVESKVEGYQNTADSAYNNLLDYRAKVIELAIKNSYVSKAKSNREVAMFLYYNNLISDVKKERAEQQTIAINKTIDEPLTQEELDAHVFAIKHAYRQITQDRFFDMLLNSSEDIEEVKAMATIKKGSNFKRDRERAIKKATRNTEVLLMRKNGLTIRAIAESMNLSTKTVQTIINKERESITV